MDSKNARNTVRIELTEEQKKQMREQTGQEVDSVEFTVEQLEPFAPAAPMQVTNLAA